MTRHSHHSHHSHDRAATVSTLAGVSALAAVYVYFLVFAQFGFVEFLRKTLAADSITLLKAALVTAGIAGSALAAFRFNTRSGVGQLVRGFIGCGFGAVLALIARNGPVATTAAVLVGGSLGWTTVMLALCLRPTLHLRKLGLWCGAAIGFSYALANQPAVFESSPRTRIFIAIGAAVYGLCACYRIKSEPSKPSSSLDYRPTMAWLWIGLFLAIVWLNASALHVIQHNPLLKQETWEGAQGIALVYLFAAILAGLALERHQPALTVGTALALLIGACFLLDGAERLLPAAHVLYTAGVSIYSTALVFFAARSGRPWLVGCVFALAGWMGAAAGTSMAQSQDRVPIEFIVVTVLAAACVFVARHFWIRRTRTAGIVQPPEHVQR